MTDKKLKVFVSYSRADVLFADQLVIALEDRGFAPIIDRHDIHEGEEWKPRLHRLIIGADVIVFVLSERSAGSPVCAWEVEEALSLGKRIIPVVAEPVPSSVKPPEGLADRNYIHFYPTPSIPGSGFAAGIRSLATALDTDIEWLRTFTRLVERATEWHGAGKAEDRLPRGEDFKEAQACLSETPAGQVVPQLLRKFLTAAADAETKREAAAKAQIEEREAALTLAQTRGARLRRVTLGGMVVASVLMILAGWLGVNAFRASDDFAAATSRIFAQQAIALSDPDTAEYERALLFALLGDPGGEARTAGWFSGNRLNPHAQAQLEKAVVNGSLKRTLSGHEEWVLSAGFSPDGTLIVTGSYDRTAKLWDVDEFILIPEVEAQVIFACARLEEVGMPSFSTRDRSRFALLEGQPDTPPACANLK